MLLTYQEFFARVVQTGLPGTGADTGATPYRYQEQLATEPWPDMLDVPTGLGKTAAITVAWLYRRLARDPATPRRLIWCLPMRVLVEQTRTNAADWVERSRPLFEAADLAPPRVHVMMGGEADDDWAKLPERAAVIVGTQDMLLSRALMRGYGASRYRWPIDFAVLHNDSLWVFDEVQLMGAGLHTSAQLEAFRRSADMPLVMPSRTLWSSATLRPEWLGTVDFRPYLPRCRVLGLPDADRDDPRVQKRAAATKRLVPSAARLSGVTKADVKAYVDDLCEEILAAHTGAAPTLVILNRVARAQDVFGRLRRRLSDMGSSTVLLLVHARFRGAERASLSERLRGIRPDDDVIVVATQAVEAGVDVTSRHLFTELAPWSSLVQRFGRCNRGGEYPEATVRWMDIAAETESKLAPPYTTDDLGKARDLLHGLESASSAQLPPVEDTNEPTHVLRRKDFIDLFNTEPDLSGFDIDVSPYLRDPGGADLEVFWRNVVASAVDEPKPDREELCRVPIGALRDHLQTVKRRPYIWNTLEARWEPIQDTATIRPGQVLMLEAEAGGYDAELGFAAGSRAIVEPMDAEVLGRGQPDTMADDPTAEGDYVELADHLLEAERQARALAGELPMSGAEIEVVAAALWHDVGKAHPAFQGAILARASEAVDRARLWAKSPGAGRLRYGIVTNGEFEPRRHFRHELASALAWLEAGAFPSDDARPAGPPGDEPCDPDRDLVAYLIAAHHGKVRSVLRALPNETRPPDDRLYARGVWDGDQLPPVVVNGLRTGPLELRLDLMRLGEGDMGPSWSARAGALMQRWGPFRLAWLETMVRLADWRASAQPSRKVLDELVRRVVTVADPERIILFGSGATGDMHGSSDLDILVVKRGGFHRGRLAEEIYRALRGLGAAVDVIVAKPEDLEELGQSSPFVLSFALRYGRELYAA